MTATATPSIIVENIPTRLRQRDQWAGFIWAERHGRRTKIPINPRTGKPAKTNDPTTWGTFDEAIAAVERYGLAGAGYIFAKDDPYFGVDVDGCHDPETGELDDRGQRMLDLLGHTYWEVSPSNTGIKGIGRGRLPITDGRTGRRHTGLRIEVYQERRFWAMTGQRLEDTPRAITDCQAQADHLFAALFPPRSAPTQPRSAPPPGTSRRTDDAVIARIRESPQRAKLDRLMAGAAGDNWSSADQSLCNILAFWTRDAAQIERIWSRSALANRDKWKRADYRNWTITSALDWITEYYIWPEDQPRGFGTNGSGPHADAAEAPPGPSPRPMTDLGNAERLVDGYGTNIHYCHPWGRWLVWDGRRWADDRTGALDRFAFATARRIKDELDGVDDPDKRKQVYQHAARSESAGKLQAMVRLAQSLPTVAVLPDDLDANHWLLNVQNGTIDLRSGELRPHARADLITKLCPVEFDASATCPAWHRFLERILPDETVRAFLQRLVGYVLTGSIKEQVFPIFWGTGSNGKSTLLGTLQHLLGEYATEADPATFMVQKYEGVRDDLADLKGARLVTTAETNEGRRIDEALIKRVTGGERIKARKLYGDLFEYDPTFTVLLATNHRPAIQDTTLSIWRRVKLVPFTITIGDDEKDPDLPDTLQAELPGILQWAVDGCLAWQRDGLGTPETIKQATSEYRAAEDVLGAFITERCVLEAKATIQAAVLYQSYRKWCEHTGEQVMTGTAFGRRLHERLNLDKTKTKTGWFYLGIRLADDTDGDGFGDG